MITFPINLRNITFLSKAIGFQDDKTTGSMYSSIMFQTTKFSQWSTLLILRCANDKFNQYTKAPKQPSENSVNICSRIFIKRETFTFKKANKYWYGYKKVAFKAPQWDFISKFTISAKNSCVAQRTVILKNPMKVPRKLFSEEWF